MEKISSSILEPAAQAIVDENTGALSELLTGAVFDVFYVGDLDFNGMRISIDSLTSGGHEVGANKFLKLKPLMSIAPQSTTSTSTENVQD